MSLKKDFYFLSPVEVVKVTSQNLEEVAEWCGGKVASTESRRVAGRQDKYVWVPTPKGTAISWAFPGMFITKRCVRTVKDDMRITYAVFRRDYFEKNYFETPGDAVDQTWGKSNTKKVKHPKHPGMAGKPAPLSLNVEVPPGSTAEEVKKAMDEAVDVLSEQGVLKASDPVVQDEALEAIAKSDGGPKFDGDEVVEHQQTASPREIHDMQIESVSFDKEPNAFGGIVEQVEVKGDSGVLEESGEIAVTNGEAPERPQLGDPELRERGMPQSFEPGYKPVYWDEVNGQPS